MPGDDLLTLEEAERRLPRIREILHEAVQLKHQIEVAAASMDYDAALMEAEKERFKPWMLRMSELISELGDLGGYLKDLDLGLVDFLTFFDGRNIFLCWRMNEDHIGHWHELDEGFSHRQEILQLDEIYINEAEFEVPKVEDEKHG